MTSKTDDAFFSCHEEKRSNITLQFSTVVEADCFFFISPKKIHPLYNLDKINFLNMIFFSDIISYESGQGILFCYPDYIPIMYLELRNLFEYLRLVLFGLLLFIYRVCVHGEMPLILHLFISCVFINFEKLFL